MRAIEIAPDRLLQLVELPEPELRPGEARVRVAFCGICGSDLHMSASRTAPAGAVMGHEFSGRIVELSPDVAGWKPGDRVCVFPFAPCGRCTSCLAGDEHVCVEAASTGLGLGVNQGAYAETVVVPRSTLRRLPDELPDEHGALAEPLAVGLHGVSIAAADPAAPVAVIGAGPIGAMTALALRLRGFERIVVIEPNAARRGLAEALGFRAVGLAHVQETILDALGGAPPAAIFECAGARTTLQLAVESIAPTGRVVLLGSAWRPVRLSLLALLTKEAQIHASFAYRRREFDEAVELLAAGRVPAEELITDIAPLADAPAMFEELARPETRQLKVLLRP
jgi:2-desacetyl-2-hydroxyethyl bacteriochlorophyllide A dehydrogenase